MIEVTRLVSLSILHLPAHPDIHPQDQDNLVLVAHFVSSMLPHPDLNSIVGEPSLEM